MVVPGRPALHDAAPRPLRPQEVVLAHPPAPPPQRVVLILVVLLVFVEVVDLKVEFPRGPHEGSE